MMIRNPSCAQIHRTHRQQRPRLLRYRLLWMCALVSMLAGTMGCQPPIQTPPEVKQLIAKLRHAQARTRWQSAQKLGAIGPQAAPAAKALLRALKDPHWLVRAHAEYALPRLGKQALPAIQEALHANNISYQQGGDTPLARIVRELHSHFLPHLVERARKHHGSARTWALSAITLTGAKALPLFASLLKAQENDLRASVARAYPGLGPYAHKGIQALAQSLRDRVSYVRQQAAESLRIIGTQDPTIHAQMLELLLKDTDVRVKIKAAQALAQWRTSSAAAVDRILDILDAPSALTYFHFQLIEPLGHLTRALGKQSPKQTKRAVKMLIRLLQHQLSSLRLKAVEAITTIGPQARGATPTLFSLLANEPRLRSLILRAFNQLLDLSSLHQLTHHKAPQYRQLAAVLLVHHLHDSHAFPQVHKLLQDPAPAVRQSILKALHQRSKSHQADGHKTHQATPSTHKRPLTAQICQRIQGLLVPLATQDKDTEIQALALETLVSFATFSRKSTKSTTKSTAKPPTQPSTRSAQKPETKTTTKPTTQPTAKPGTKPTAPDSLPVKRPTSRPLAHFSLESLLVRSLRGPVQVQRAVLRALVRLPGLSDALWAAVQGGLQAATQPKSILSFLQTIAAHRRRQLSDDAFAQILGYAQHENDKLREAACAALATGAKQATSARQAQALMRLLPLVRTDTNPAVVQAASESLGLLVRGFRQRDTVGLQTLHKVVDGLLKQSAHALRKRGLAFVELLPLAHQRRHLDALLHIMQQDRQTPYRELAAGILAAQWKDVSVALWGRALYDASLHVRLSALSALDRVPKIAEAIPGLVALVWGREVNTESRAIALLGRHKVKRAADVIAARLRARAWLTRAHAAQALGQIKELSPAQKAALQQATQDIHEKVRRATREALSAPP